MSKTARKLKLQQTIDDAADLMRAKTEQKLNKFLREESQATKKSSDHVE